MNSNLYHWSQSASRTNQTTAITAARRHTHTHTVHAQSRQGQDGGPGVRKSDKEYRKESRSCWTHYLSAAWAQFNLGQIDLSEQSVSQLLNANSIKGRVKRSGPSPRFSSQSKEEGSVTALIDDKPTTTPLLPLLSVSAATATTATTATLTSCHM